MQYKVPPEIQSIAHALRNLDLSSNRITQLPVNLFTQMQLLKTLNLSNNKIGIFSNLFSRKANYIRNNLICYIIRIFTK